MNNKLIPIEMWIFVSVFIRNAWEMFGIPFKHNVGESNRSTKLEGCYHKDATDSTLFEQK